MEDSEESRTDTESVDSFPVHQERSTPPSRRSTRRRVIPAKLKDSSIMAKEELDVDLISEY